MVKWKLVFTKQALKDSKKIKSSGLKEKVESILKILEENPFENNPSFEKLTGDLTGAYSRRINIQHRVIYQVYKKEKTVKIIRMWTHYE
ncbi:MAG: Txe/YoeB family addiction module toxin [Ignavibacteria bacterium]